jgi:hypothetical protein
MSFYTSGFYPIGILLGLYFGNKIMHRIFSEENLPFLDGLQVHYGIFVYSFTLIIGFIVATIPTIIVEINQEISSGTVKIDGKKIETGPQYISAVASHWMMLSKETDIDRLKREISELEFKKTHHFGGLSEHDVDNLKFKKKVLKQWENRSSDNR